MPLFPEGQDPLGPTGMSGTSVSAPTPAFAPQPTSGQMIGAALNKNSLYAGVMGFAHAVSNSGIPPEPGYDVMSDIKGTPWETNFLTSFLGSRSSAETAAIKAQIVQHQQDNETLASSGTTGTFLIAIARTTDPLIFIPAIVAFVILRNRIMRRRSAKPSFNQ